MKKINYKEGIYESIQQITGNKDFGDAVSFINDELAVIIINEHQHLKDRKWVTVITHKHGELITMDVPQQQTEEHIVFKFGELLQKMGYRFVTCKHNFQR